MTQEYIPAATCARVVAKPCASAIASSRSRKHCSSPRSAGAGNSLAWRLVTSRALVLFDIDGTLVRRAGPEHREALVHAVRRVAGLDTTTDGIPLHGMLDPDILTVMMRRAGCPLARIREGMPEIVAVAERFYLRVCPALRDKHCPGVEKALQRLTRHGALLGLVTGNLTRIGWRKLERAGLRDYFRFGAFGEMAKTRAGLARLAISHAKSNAWIDRRAPVSLIGDASSDIVAARKNGIRAIAVLTGITPREELEALAPDHLLRDLRALRLHMVQAGAKPPGTRSASAK